MISNEVRLLIPKIQAYLAGQPVKRAWLFGSCSRGEETKDIDILVQYDETARVTQPTISRIIRDLGRTLKRRHWDLRWQGSLTWHWWNMKKTIANA